MPRLPSSPVRLGLLVLCGILLLPVHPLAGSESDNRQAAEDAKIVQALLRLKGIDVNGTPRLKSAVLRHLAAHRGSETYVELIDRLKVRGVEDELLNLALTDASGTAGVRAAALLLAREEEHRFKAVLHGRDEQKAVQAAQVLGFVGDDTTLELLRPLVTSAAAARSLQVAAATALGRNRQGQQFLLQLVKQQRLPPQLNFAVANALHGSLDPRIRQEVGEHLKLPAAVNSKPLPPLGELVRRSGDAGRGRQLFATTATCIKCHKVNGQGKEVGPDLTEIGTKLSREALFVSILDPSAGISHNFETYAALLKSGNMVSGILINRTDEAVTLRTAEAIDNQIPVNELDELVKTEVSLMPAGMQKLLALQDLVDLVEYLTTLKKK